MLSKAGTPNESEFGTHVIFQHDKTGSVGITSVQLPEYQRLIIYYSGDKAAIEAILRQSLKNASEIQEIPIISFGNSVSIFDVPIDRLMHIRERTDRALQKSTLKEGAGTEPMK